MLLQRKTAIVYGAAGPVGSAVARAYAREGAHVVLCGRTRDSLEALAAELPGTVDVEPVDVLDRAALTEHTAHVLNRTGRIDVAFNATSNDDIQGTPLSQMPLEDVLQPVTKAVRAHINIGTVLGDRMAVLGGGAILGMGGGREAIPNLGGSHIAWAALTGVCRQLAAEYGPAGVRVCWILSPGSPDPGQTGTDADGSHTILGRRPTYTDVGNAAAFLSSDWASTITAAEINLTGGLVVD
jgi:3-oxoacyl-[acyl-carrier protein] reductase